MARFLFVLLTMIAALSANISFAASTVTIVAKAEAGGTISPSGNVAVEKGKSVKFFIVPSNPEIYEVADVLVNGKSKGPITKYNFSSVTAKQSISAKFKKRIYQQKITNKNPSLGKLVYKSATNLTYGKSFELKAVPGKGYKSVITVDGYVVAKGGANVAVTYKHKVQKKHAILAYFYKTTPPVNLNKTKPVSTSTVPKSTVSTSTASGGNATGSTDSTASHGIKLNWAVPTLRANGEQLLLSEIAGYEVYYTSADLSVSDIVAVSGAPTTSGVVMVPAAGTYYFSISTVDINGEKSEMSSSVEVIVN